MFGLACLAQMPSSVWGGEAGPGRLAFRSHAWVHVVTEKVARHVSRSQGMAQRRLRSFCQLKWNSSYI